MCSSLVILGVVGVTAMGINQTPANISGAYTTSCGTSYCRGVEMHCTPQVPASSYLNRKTGYGYSVKYNYGVQPDWVTAESASIGSNSYNYGR